MNTKTNGTERAQIACVRKSRYIAAIKPIRLPNEFIEKPRAFTIPRTLNSNVMSIKMFEELLDIKFKFYLSEQISAMKTGVDTNIAPPTNPHIKRDAYNQNTFFA